MQALGETRHRGGLEHAIQIAAAAYAGHTDKGGETYMLHPLRLMQQFDDETTRIVAVLHDVVEDSDWEFADLTAAGFDDEVVDAVRALTKRDGESYADAIDRAKANPIARDVKRVDLEDNMDITRLDALPEGATDNLRKYHRSWRRLQE